jgi:hypothetical protein
MITTKSSFDGDKMPLALTALLGGILLSGITPVSILSLRKL